ncbi:MAG: hypothetical protein EHM53_03250 [Methanoregulaceae archaeon]|nr:MAG: hypothetical protein EHM53_03250 [Methanoregulaceae archaeon]
MRCPGFFLFLVVIACIFLADCTQLSGTVPGTPAVPVPSLPPSGTAIPNPPAVEPAVPPAAATSAPPQVPAIIHQVSQVKDVKDSELLFSLQVPVEWSVSTHRLENPENFVGFMYQTDLVGNNTFTIHTFTNYRWREQNYRDECRRWIPAPNESVVTINDITFDRFESTANGSTKVAYVARQTSANEHGYLSVLAFTANTSNRFEKEDYDKVVASFRYYGCDVISTMPGEEIVRIAPPEDEGGNMRSASGRSSSAAASAGSSSAGSSSAGTGVCGRRR